MIMLNKKFSLSFHCHYHNIALFQPVQSNDNDNDIKNSLF